MNPRRFRVTPRARSARAGLVATLALATACARPSSSAPSPEAAYDLVILGGRIVDGTGNPWFMGDLAIRGDRIAAITPSGGLARARTKHTLPANGLVVAPGFIDIQSHSWGALLRGDGRVVGKVTQGVTTEILGESTTPAPINDAMLALQGFEPGDTSELRRLHETFRGDRGFGAWLDALERNGNSVNAGSYLGATTVRAYAKGSAPGEPTAAELDTMRAVVRRAMEDGAFGISSALIYPPGSYAGTMELTEAAKAMAPYRGAYITHIRNEEDSLLPALDEALRIGRDAGVPVVIYHLKASGPRNWPKSAIAVAKIDSARKAGQDVIATMYPYEASGNNLSACVPDWVAANGKLLDNLRDSSMRARIVREMTDGPPAPQLCQVYGPEAIMVTGFRRPELQKFEGMRLAAIADSMKLPWAQAAIELTLLENNRLGKINFAMSEENVIRQLQAPWVVIGTDAGGIDPDSARGLTHPRAYGSYPRILGRFVRDQGALRLEDAIRRMTSGVAQTLGLRDRGLLREGMYADIAIFDPATVIDRATYQRPHQLSEGVRHVFVNGVAVLADGRHTGAKPGRVVRGPGWRGR